MSTRRRTYVWLFGCSRTGFGGKLYFEKTHTNTADDLSSRTHTHTHIQDRQFGRSRYRRHPSRPSLEVGASIPRAAARVWSPGGRPVSISSVVIVLCIYIIIIIVVYYSVYYIYVHIEYYIYVHSAASPNYSDR